MQNRISNAMEDSGRGEPESVKVWTLGCGSFCVEIFGKYS